MSYSANQYNYATPLSSTSNLVKDVVTGAQMLDFSAWLYKVNSVGVIRGTYTADSEQATITITATQDDAYTPFSGPEAFHIPAKPNTQYTLSCLHSGAEGQVLLFGNGSITNLVASAATATDIKITLLTGPDVTFLTFRVGVLTAGQAATFKRIMICEGAEAKAWERYNNRRPYPIDKKYFTLFDNKLDGSYFPIVDDIGLWGTTLSDTTGALPTPYVLTINEALSVRAFRMIGSQYSYPTKFTVVFYNSNNIVATIDYDMGFIDDDNNVIVTTAPLNDSVEYYYYFYSVLSITKVVLTITHVSHAGVPVRLFNVFNPDIMKRDDTLSLKLRGVSTRSDAILKSSTDSLRLKAAELNVPSMIGHTTDNLKVIGADVPNLINIHSVMKQPSRQIYGKVYITYTDPMLDVDTVISSNYIAYNSNMRQLLDGIKVSKNDLFTLYENNLTGTYAPSDENTQVGWTSGMVSDSNGEFHVAPYLQVSFAARPIVGLPIVFDNLHGCLPKNFNVVLAKADGTTITKTFINNTSKEVIVTDEVVVDVVSIQITISSCTKPGYPVTILEIPVTSTFIYKGYQDDSQLMSISILEELTYEDDIEALGGVSANETTIVLDNSSKDFYFNNPESPAASQLKRNRKIEPYLGAEVTPGRIEWYKLGTYWSYKWDVPMRSLTATVVGFDTLGLLDTTSYTEHVVQTNKSIGALIEYVLNDAKKQLNFIQYKIDASLYDIVVPYAWFEAKSHTAALRKISGCYPMHIYCDREGQIIAAPQQLHKAFFYDVWSDSTNIIDKSYSSLYTTVPNIINVVVANATIIADTQLARDDTVFSTNATRILNFNKPYLSDIRLEITCDDTVTYTYTVYSWGIKIAFGGSGIIHSIECYGTALDMSDTSTITQRDELSIHLNGSIARNIQSDFIQTAAHAQLLIDRLNALSTYDKYDVTVDYRGDISLTINNPIILHDGIAPTNKYTIKRHELYWDGALTGSADLNT